MTTVSTSLTQKIGQMIMMGFKGTTPNNQGVQSIKKEIAKGRMIFSIVNDVDNAILIESIMKLAYLK